MKVLAVLFLSCLSSIVWGQAGAPQDSQGKTNFKCTLSVIHQSDIKNVYEVEGEQNPPVVEYDFKGPELQTHYFNLLTTGKLVNQFVETQDSHNWDLRLWFTPVTHKANPSMPPELEEGVRLKMDTSYGETYAGLGMRDSYKSYAQSVIMKLADDSYAIAVLNCLR